MLGLCESGCKFEFFCPLKVERVQYFTNLSIQIPKSDKERHSVNTNQPTLPSYLDPILDTCLNKRISLNLHCFFSVCSFADSPSSPLAAGASFTFCSFMERKASRPNGK